MQPRTRDNIIYLAVGLTIAGLVSADTLYHLKHGTQAWIPTKFAFRAVYSALLLEYFMIRQSWKAKLLPHIIVACALLAAVLHLLFMFGFRDLIGHLAGIPFSALAVFEIFLIVASIEKLADYLQKKPRRIVPPHR